MIDVVTHAAVAVEKKNKKKQNWVLFISMDFSFGLKAVKFVFYSGW